jgi:CDP-paratose 2-epimerase
VRDLLHPQDLCELVDLQLARLPALSGEVFNVGGGRAGSVSLQEYTALCREATGRVTRVEEDPATSAVDIPWYISDHTKVTSVMNWRPRRSPRVIAQDIAQWLRAHESTLSDLIV